MPGMEEAKLGWLPFALFTMATDWGSFCGHEKSL